MPLAAGQARVPRRSRTTNGPEASGPDRVGASVLRAVVYVRRSAGDAEQVERAPVGQRHQLEPPPAVRVSAGEAQRVPPERVLAAERQLGHVVHLRVEQVRSSARARRSAPSRAPASASARGLIRRRERASRPSARRVRRDPGASPHLLRRHGIARAAGCRPSECYGSFCTIRPPFEASSPAPSHHLGVDVFVGR